MRLTKTLSTIFSGGNTARLPPKLYTTNGIPPHRDWNSIAGMFLHVDANKPDDRHQGVFHPSAGLTWEIDHCIRNIMFDLVCAPKSEKLISPKLAKILDNGHDRHKGLNSLFKRMAAAKHQGMEAFEHDIPAKHPTLPIAGEADGRIHMANGHRYIVDFKTINLANFKKLNGSSGRYLYQLNTYMGILNEKVGYVLYECKDNQDWAEPMELYRHVFSKEMFDQTEQFAKDVLNMLWNEDVPAFDSKVCDAHVTFCGYRNVCNKHKQGLMTLQQMDRRSDGMKRHHLKVIQ